MFTPVVFNRDELFRFGGAVGPLAPNSTDDVAKVEIALDGLGFFTVNRRRGPSGEFHAELDQGLRAFQRARGLKEDATVKPDGPTIRKLAQETAEASGPDEIDDSAPPSDSGGIKDIKADPAAVRDALGLLNDYLKGVAKDMKNIKLPRGPGGGAGRPSGRTGQFNRKTNRFDDIFE